MKRGILREIGTLMHTKERNLRRHNVKKALQDMLKRSSEAGSLAGNYDFEATFPAF